MRQVPGGGRSLPLRPFQVIQIDFTELPPVHQWRYLLVLVDHLTHWVEAMPTARATANVVSKMLLEEIIPRYGLINRINSERGTHFTSRIVRQLMASLGIRWELHTPWHPQSSGQVERMNQTLKRTLTKLMIETQMSWVKCLPLALLRIRTQPRSDIGVSPYEMMFGLPYMTGTGETISYEGGEQQVRKYVQTIGKALQHLKAQGMLSQTVPLDFQIHTCKAGDWVLIKKWKEQTLTPQWEGQFQVLLTTETAVHTAERGWTHATRIKGPVEPPIEWTLTSTPGDLKLKLSKQPL